MKVKMEFIPFSNPLISISDCGEYLYTHSHGYSRRIEKRVNVNGDDIYLIKNNGLGTGGERVAFKVSDLVAMTFENCMHELERAEPPLERHLKIALDLVKEANRLDDSVLEAHWLDIEDYPKYQQNAVSGLIRRKGNSEPLKLNRFGSVTIYTNYETKRSIKGGYFLVPRVNPSTLQVVDNCSEELARKEKLHFMKELDLA